MRYSGLLLCVFSASTVLAQKPVIRGIVNSASFAGGINGAAVVASGAIFTIFGESLAVSERTVPLGRPLPYSLGGTSVTVAAIPAPLVYVSPGQINFQVPNAILELWQPKVPVAVTNAAGASEAVLAEVLREAPGIFTQDGSGCGAGLVQNVFAQGVYTLNSRDNSASPGGYIVVYGTGLGYPVGAPPDGQPSPEQQFRGAVGLQLSTLGPRGFDQWSIPRAVDSRRVPGLVGIDEVILQLPQNAPEGCAVPFKFVSYQKSQPVTISIHRNGGQCEDPPPASVGLLSWKKVVTVSKEFPEGLSRETFSASFVSAPENQLVAPPDLDATPGESIMGGGGGILSENPRCADTGLKALDAGALTLEGIPGGPLTVPASSAATYTVTVPAGSLESGKLQVTAAGGSDVAAFDTGLSVPPPIEIVAPGPIYRQYPYTVKWKNGSPDALLRMLLIGSIGAGGNTMYQVRALASNGEITLRPGPSGLNGEPFLPLPGGIAEVVLIVTPRAGRFESFSVPGLTRGGRHGWTYEYHFTDIPIY